MYVDARQLSAGAGLVADVCVVGAGPAGLALASRLIDHGLHVLVLESGAERSDEAVLALNHGTVVGDRYAGLSATRHRGIGGTTSIWNTTVRGEVGAKYVPLDAVDFELRPESAPSGWPLGYEELAPYYRDAAVSCGLDVAEDSADPAGRVAQPRPATTLLPRLYHLGTRRDLLNPLLDRIRASDSSLCCNATVLSFEADGGGTGVARAIVGTLDGERRVVNADRFVLAAGAVENARLLLLSAGRPGEFGNEGDWLGRCFMEHPRDTSVTFRPPSSAFFRNAAFYDVHEGPGGGLRLGRLGLDPEVVRRGELPNASATLLPVVRRSMRRVRAGLGRLADVFPLAGALPAGGHGWAEHPVPGLVYDGMMVLLNVEQAPHPENRLRLIDDRDGFGLRRVELHWRLQPADRNHIDRLRRTVAEVLRASGFGQVDVDEKATVDPNAHHHAGTTRMAVDPEHGVVDPNLRVHGMDNLYVTGASVFPTAGYANPLLTVLALSFRLGDHLGRESGGIHTFGTV